MKAKDLSLVPRGGDRRRDRTHRIQMDGHPVAKLNESERNKTLHLADELHKAVVGQDEGVELVTEAIIRSKAGIKDPASPSGPSCSSDLPVWARRSLRRRWPRAV